MSCFDQEIDWTPIDLANMLDKSQTTSVFVNNWRSIAFGLEMDVAKQHRIDKQSDYCFKTILCEILLDWISRVGQSEAKLSHLILVLESNGCKDMADFLRKKYPFLSERDECLLTNHTEHDTARGACIQNYGTSREIENVSETLLQSEYSLLHPTEAFLPYLLQRLSIWILLIACCISLILMTIFLVKWLHIVKQNSEIKVGYIQLRNVSEISYKVKLFTLSEWTPGGVVVNKLDVIGCKLSSNGSFLDFIQVLNEFQNVEEISIDLNNSQLCGPGTEIPNMPDVVVIFQIKILYFQNFESCPRLFEEITKMFSLSYLQELRIINGTVDDSNIGFLHQALEQAMDLNILELKVDFKTKQYFYTSSSVLQNAKSVFLHQVSVNSTYLKYLPIGDNFCQVFSRLEQLEVTNGYIEYDKKDFLSQCQYLEILDIRLRCPFNTFSRLSLEFNLPNLRRVKIFVKFLTSCPGETEVASFNETLQAMKSKNKYETLSVCTSCYITPNSGDNWCCIFLPSRIVQFLLGYDNYNPLKNEWQHDCNSGT